MCEYCNFKDATLPWFKTINDGDFAYDGIDISDDGTISLYFFEEVDGCCNEIKTPIAYCPFCGRKLN